MTGSWQHLFVARFFLSVALILCLQCGVLIYEKFQGDLASGAFRGLWVRDAHSYDFAAQSPQPYLCTLRNAPQSEIEMQKFAFRKCVNFELLSIGQYWSPTPPFPFETAFQKATIVKNQNEQLALNQLEGHLDPHPVKRLLRSHHHPVE